MSRIWFCKGNGEELKGKRKGEMGVEEGVEEREGTMLDKKDMNE